MCAAGGDAVSPWDTALAALRSAELRTPSYLRRPVTRIGVACYRLRYLGAPAPSGVDLVDGQIEISWSGPGWRATMRGGEGLDWGWRQSGIEGPASWQRGHEISRARSQSEVGLQVLLSLLVASPPAAPL